MCLKKPKKGVLEGKKYIAFVPVSPEGFQTKKNGPLARMSLPNSK
jgi:hypothetical protein